MTKSPSIPPLRVFLSYASEQENIAEKIYYKLKTAEHDVFFDRTNLPPGEEYDRAILHRIRSSDLFVFLISPDSIQDGAYTRTELRFARDTWPNPEGHVLSVLAMSTDFSQIPPYLTTLTVLRPEGDLPAEVCARVHDLATGRTPQDTIAGKAHLIDEVVEQLRRSERVAEIDTQWDIERKMLIGTAQPEQIPVAPWYAMFGLLIPFSILILPAIYYLATTPLEIVGGEYAILIWGYVILGCWIVRYIFKTNKANKMKVIAYKEAAEQYRRRRMRALSGKQDKSSVLPKALDKF